jgi:hypothetical protein
MATANIRHPVTGEESSFEYPDDNTDPIIRFEFADSTLGEFENPNAEQPVTSEEELPEGVTLVVDSESGLNSDQQG